MEWKEFEVAVGNLTFEPSMIKSDGQTQTLELL